MKSAGQFEVGSEAPGTSDRETSEESDEELFYVKKMSSKGKGPIWITPTIQGKPVKMELISQDLDVSQTIGSYQQEKTNPEIKSEATDIYRARDRDCGRS